MIGSLLRECFGSDKRKANRRRAEELKNRGNEKLSRGDLEGAAADYREAVVLDPGFADAHSNLGFVLKEQQRLPEAEASLRQALALNPDLLPARFNLACLKQQAGDLAHATQELKAVLEKSPWHAEALERLGAVCCATSDFAGAVAALEHLADTSANPAACCNLGYALKKLGRYEEAEQAYRRGLALAETNADLLSNLGVLCRELKRYGEAETLYRKAIALEPGNARIRNNLGVAEADLDRHADAERDFRLAIESDPDFEEARINLAGTFEKQGRLAEAEKTYLELIALKPAHPVSYLNLGLLVLQHRKDFAAAERWYCEGLARAPGHASLQYNLSLLLLQLGRYEEAWRLYSARRRVIPPVVSVPDFDLPYWNGEPLSGRSILVWGEQGYGDQIQFARYVPLLKRSGAARVDLACKPALHPLFESLGGADAIIPMDEKPDLSSYDCWVMQLDVPGCMGTTLAAIPAALPYLSASEERIVRWRGAVAAPGLRVGLVWKGNPEFKGDTSRSLPGLRALADLWRNAGVSFISLQKGAGEEEANASPADQPLIALGAGIEDFGDTAAIVSQLDLVISSCTSMVHVAGALGKPCWVMLSYNADWRWLEGRDDSPWYPDAVRLFRQPSPGDWATVVRNVSEALQAYAVERGLQRA
ncbi:MAG TPA: tetratricopeptide repeat protein [Rhodocyclaceae bacterium]